MISEDKILNLIGVQIQQIINSDVDTYNGYNFCVTNELMFVKDKKKNELLKNNPKQIFIVVKFLPATLNYGQVLMPILINAIAEKNKLDVCYRLLIEYAETFNLTLNADETIKQYYSSPSVLSNFNEIGDGFRSLINMSGTFQISENIITAKIFSSDNPSALFELPLISFTPSFDIQLESQSFYNSSERTKSIGKVGTFTMNLTMYLIDNDFVKKVLNIVTGVNGVNQTFYFNIEFKNGIKMLNVAFKLANFTFEQQIGNLPVATMTFTN